MVIMIDTKKIHYQLEHFYPGFNQQKFWDLFVDHEAWSKSEFLPGKININKSGQNHPQGLGAIRTIVTGSMTIKEDIVGFRSPEYFSYATHNGSLPVDNLSGQIFITSEKDGVLLRYKGSFNPKYFGTGWFFKRLLSSGQKSVLDGLEKAYKTYYFRNY